MDYKHKTLAAGRWHTMTLAEQLGNIGSEVHRARIAKEKGFEDRFRAACDRALELFDLTLADSRWKGRLFELGRMRDVFADTLLGGHEYATDLKALEPYFDRFALLSAREAAH